MTESLLRKLLTAVPGVSHDLHNGIVREPICVRSQDVQAPHVALYNDHFRSSRMLWYLLHFT